MKCLNCDLELQPSSRRPSKYCSDRCRMAFARNKRTDSPRINEQIEEDANKRTEEQELQKAAVIDGETPNAKSAREYREWTAENTKGACESFLGVCAWYVNCETCGKAYSNHHEARYMVICPVEVW